MESKDAAARQQDLLGIEEDIMAGQDNAAAQPLIDHVNKTENKPYYYIQYPTGDEGWGAAFTSNTLVADKLPLITKDGVQTTMNEVRQRAAAMNLTVNDFLAHPRVGILEKVGENDYSPINR